MCGISGFINRTGLDSSRLIDNFLVSINHRGPDSNGVWFDQNQSVYLGHTRLSIVDLSDTGCQPMLSKDGRYILVFNGEIYNYNKLRQLLQDLGAEFSGTSDSEVLVTMIQYYGFIDTLNQLDGMFAFSVWDTHERKLMLARDRVGIKPLYYTFTNGFSFSSELSSFNCFTNTSFSFNKLSVQEYFQRGFISGSKSVYNECFKLLPGHYLIVDSSNISQTEPPSCFYDTASHFFNSPKHSLDKSSLDLLHSSLLSSVSSQMNADVPLGCFLSGGIDSSLVAALMQEVSPVPIDTFSIGFLDSAYNEAPYAKTIAGHLNTNHHELYLTPNDLVDTARFIPTLYDEPFADASQIPTYLLCKFSRSNVKVCLSGDGGDELFGGYNRYLFALKYWNRLSKVPYSIRKLFSSLLLKVLPITSSKAFNFIQEVFSNTDYSLLLSSKLFKVSSSLSTHDILSFYESVCSFSFSPAFSTYYTSPSRYSPDTLAFGFDLLDALLYLDFTSDMVDGVLTKVDRVSMRNGLEVRVPLLGNTVVDYALSLSSKSKIMNGLTKYPLRCILSRYIPISLFERPKMGFSVPISTILQTSLYEELSDYIHSDSLYEIVPFKRSDLINLQSEDLNRKLDASSFLWAFYSFSRWFYSSY